jgi:hypothetical protein
VPNMPQSETLIYAASLGVLTWFLASLVMVAVCLIYEVLLDGTYEWDCGSCSTRIHGATQEEFVERVRAHAATQHTR